MTAVVLFSWLTSFGVAEACECQTLSPCEAVSYAHAILTGTVTEVWPELTPDGTARATLTRIVADRAFLGSTGTYVVRDNLSSCGYRFTVGERYLVYATQRPDGDLAVSVCSRTTRLVQADDDLNHLAALPSLGIGGRIYGTIERIEIDLLGTREGASLQRPVQRLTVSLTGSDAQRRIRSGPDGRFETAGLPPGEYRVHLEVPPVLKAQHVTAVSVADRGCARVQATLMSNGRIQGQVFARGVHSSIVRSAMARHREGRSRG